MQGDDGGRLGQGVLGTFLARLGATRGGSPGIFGYTGGQGASASPDARSRSYISRSGASDCGRCSICSHGSPWSATWSGTVRSVSDSGSTSSSCSHANGVDTWPPGRARTDHAPNTVLWGAFW